MGELKLTLACGDFDRTSPMMMNKVKADGIDLNYIALQPEEIFWRMIHNEEFDASEFSLAAYFILHDRNDPRFLAIPVFPSREFRHSTVFINNHSGIKSPQDLRGKRIGVPDYTMTATVWIRGFLKDDYGISPRDVNWFNGGLNSPGRKQRVSVQLPDEINMEYIGDEKTLSDMLDKGEIDALICARAPESFHDHSPNVSRLWPNFFEAELDYYKRTGIFPIMHTIVVRREILEKYPWVAQSLNKAFVESKDICQRELYNFSAPKYMVPWYMHTYERVLDVMGHNYWPYGLEANRHVLEAFARYCYEQGLTQRLVPVDDVFAQSTLKPYTI